MISADTNVFVYLHDEKSPGKKAAAAQVVDALLARRAPISLQVVGELQNVMRRKLGYSSAEAAQAGRNILTTFPVFAATSSAAVHALAFAEVGQLSYWDGLLLFSSREVGVTTLLSEDMHDGQQFGALTVINPFGVDGLSDRARTILDL